jgi:broad specificity phosphatase PhoE
MSGLDLDLEGSEGPATVLVRHTQTAWSEAGRHTGLTDIPLTEDGCARARAIAPLLEAAGFQEVLVSPARRARETCELCGLGAHAQTLEQLHEWNYGEYEGLTSAQILAQRPGWSLWRDGCPGGEDAAEVGTRADLVIDRLTGSEGPLAVFSHGHMLRVLGARWAQLDPRAGARLALQTGAMCTLGYEHAMPVLWRWNQPAQAP